MDKKYEWNNTWHWKRIFKQCPLPPPYATSMICAVRVSPKLLAVIDFFAKKFHRLFMDEALFNTLALKANLRVVTPSELSTIVFRKKWQDFEFTKDKLYHPVKEVQRQIYLRSMLENKNTTKNNNNNNKNRIINKKKNELRSQSFKLHFTGNG